MKPQKGTKVFVESIQNSFSARDFFDFVVLPLNNKEIYAVPPAEYFGGDIPRNRTLKYRKTVTFRRNLLKKLENV